LKTVCALLLLGAAARAGEYAGKYKDDPRLTAIRATLPAQLTKARKLVEVRGGVRIELRDLGSTKSGVAARTKQDADGFVIVLHTEPLVLRAHDLNRTLVHELVHCMQKERWGARGEVTVPTWIKEGMAVYLAGQFDARARALAAHVGREAAPADAAARLLNGLDGRHTLLDYAEDAAAFAGVEARHGREKTARFIEALLSGMSPREASVKALGERWQTFVEESGKFAREKIEPLVREGRRELLALRAKVEAREFDAAAELPKAGGVYSRDDLYYRALAARGAGRSLTALEILRRGILGRFPRRTTLLAQAIALEVELLKELNRTEEHAVASRRAKLDLTPYR